jgi:hypothetical protein
MSDGHATTIDMIRITFKADPAHQDEIQAYLVELGLDVHTWDDGHVTAFWEEPEGELDPVVVKLWEMNGSPFEVTHEDFHRVNLFAYHHEDELADGSGQAVA